ncbi:hypothetical protein SAMN04487996_122169 [Dyadobacter soli]|uniref:Uncharacterized protein n=1 Tax=Dyadobacter soli TaxID=659014 RepID=A0A1G7WUH3_9BACT|nr:hypothetical protein [Dyadobacter soli]SDG75526.1 hypothetical protein SAMN04487996_122169 [Dyadobacter soli]
MKRLPLLLFCSLVMNCAYRQFITNYKIPEVSNKIIYSIGHRVRTGLVIAYDSTSYMMNGEVSREMTTRLIRIIKRNGIEEFQFIPIIGDALNKRNIKDWIRIPDANKSTYYEQIVGTSFSKPLQAYYNNPKFASKASIKTAVSARDKAVGEKWVSGEFAENPQAILSPKHHTRSYYSRRQLRNVFRTYNQPRVLYIELGAMPAVGGRILQVMNRQPNVELYSKREQNEAGIFNYGGFVKLGFDIDSRNSFYLSYMLLQQGFSAQGHFANWSDGLSTDAVGQRYDFRYSSFETGYSFNPFRERAAFSTDIGLHFLLASRAHGANKFSWGPHLSMGPKFRISGRADLRILPTGYLNLKRLETGTGTMEASYKAVYYRFENCGSAIFLGCFCSMVSKHC